MFPSFVKLPLELRMDVWRHAMDGGWSCSHFRRGTRHRPGIKMVGNIHRSRAGDACRESRALMKSTHVWTERYGWLNFTKHLFFFRDDKFDGSILSHVGEKQGMLRHVQHIVLQPREQWRMWDTMDVLLKHCQQLRTIVVIFPFVDTFQPGWRETLDISPWQDFGSVFRKSPAELDLTELYEDIEGDYAIEVRRRDHHKARIEELLVYVREVYNDEEYCYSSYQLSDIRQWEQDMQKFTVPPRLFLRRTRDGVSPAEVCISSCHLPVPKTTTRLTWKQLYHPV